MEEEEEEGEEGSGDKTPLVHQSVATDVVILPQTVTPIEETEENTCFTDCFSATQEASRLMRGRNNTSGHSSALQFLEFD